MSRNLNITTKDSIELVITNNINTIIKQVFRIIKNVKSYPLFWTLHIMLCLREVTLFTDTVIFSKAPSSSCWSHVPPCRGHQLDSYRHEVVHESMMRMDSVYNCSTYYIDGIYVITLGCTAPGLLSCSRTDDGYCFICLPHAIYV